MKKETIDEYISDYGEKLIKSVKLGCYESHNPNCGHCLADLTPWDIRQILLAHP